MRGGREVGKERKPLGFSLLPAFGTAWLNEKKRDRDRDSEKNRGRSESQTERERETEREMTETELGD